MIDISKLSLEELYSFRKKVNHEIRARIKPAPKQNIARHRTAEEITSMHVNRITQKLIAMSSTLSHHQISGVLRELYDIASLDPSKLTPAKRKEFLAQAQKLMGNFSDSTAMIHAAGSNRYFGYLKAAVSRIMFC